MKSISQLKSTVQDIQTSKKEKRIKHFPCSDFETTDLSLFVRISDEDLVTFFVYPGDAGHDYGSIEKQGFRKLAVDRDGKAEIIDNPRWLPPQGR